MLGIVTASKERKKMHKIEKAETLKKYFDRLSEEEQQKFLKLIKGGEKP
jgi:uncharacterized protein (DUF302 family)